MVVMAKGRGAMARERVGKAGRAGREEKERAEEIGGQQTLGGTRHDF